LKQSNNHLLELLIPHTLVKFYTQKLYDGCSMKNYLVLIPPIWSARIFILDEIRYIFNLSSMVEN